MNVKRFLVSVLSFAICTGQLSSFAANAEYPNNVTSYGTAAIADTAEVTAQANIHSVKGTSQEAAINALGDINNDKFIDANDASLILKAYAKISNNMSSGLTFEQANAADVNTDHHIDSIDASCILSYYSYVSTNGTLSLEDFLKADKPSTTTTTTTAAPVTTTTTAVSTTVSKTTTAVSTSKTSSTSKATTTSTASSTTTTKAVTTTSTAASTTTTAAPVVSIVSAPPTSTTTVTSSSTTTTAVTTTAVPTSTTTLTAATTSYQDPYKVQGIKLSKTEMTLTVGDGGGISYVKYLENRRPQPFHGGPLYRNRYLSA